MGKISISQHFHRFRSIRRALGFTLMELMIAVAMMGGLAVGSAELIDRYTNTTRLALTAQHAATFGQAVQSYVKSNYGTLSADASITSAVPRVLRPQDMIAADLLPPSFSQTNGYGQVICAMVFRSAKAGASNKLNVMVVTEGGRPIDDLDLGQTVGLMGGSGGAVYSNTSTQITGAQGGWVTNLADYSNKATKRCDADANGSIVIDKGRLAMALWYGMGESNVGVLYRDGGSNSLLNTMNTPLIMGSSAQQTVNATCDTVASVSADSSGNLLSCVDNDGTKTWRRSGYSFADPVDSVATLVANYPCNSLAANLKRDLEVRLVKAAASQTAISHSIYVCNAAAGTWTAIGADASGNISVPGAVNAATGAFSGSVTAGDLTVASLVNIGAACRNADNTGNAGGKLARTNNVNGPDTVVTCTDGYWRPTGAWWGQSVADYDTLTTTSFACGAGREWETRIVQDHTINSVKTGRPLVYTCAKLTDGSYVWKSVGVDKDGNLSLGGTLTAKDIVLSGDLTLSNTSKITTGRILLKEQATIGASCIAADVGALVTDGLGQVLICHGGIWKTTGTYWGPPVADIAALNAQACNASRVWETRLIQTPSNAGVYASPRAYSCSLYGGVYSWKPLGIADDGSLTVPGALGAGSLSVTGNAVVTGTTDLQQTLKVLGATTLTTLAATSATLTGQLEANSATLTGQLQAGSANLTGALTAASASLSGALTAAGNVSAAQVVVTSSQTAGANGCSAGALALDSGTGGGVLACQNGYWKPTGTYWGGPVAAYSDLSALTCDARRIWETRIVQSSTAGALPRAYTCNGSGQWKALALDDNGNLTVQGTLTAQGNVTVGGTFSSNGAANFTSTVLVSGTNSSLRIANAAGAEGSSCTSSQGAGTLGISGTGQLLQCDGGNWRATGMYWGSSVLDLAAITALSCNSANLWETRVVRNGGKPRAYTCSSTGSWIPLAADTAGNLQLDGTLAVTGNTTLSTASLSGLASFNGGASFASGTTTSFASGSTLNLAGTTNVSGTTSFTSGSSTTFASGSTLNLAGTTNVSGTTSFASGSSTTFASGSTLNLAGTTNVSGTTNVTGSMNVSGSGVLKIGNAATAGATCTSAGQGALGYEATSNSVLTCDGSSWRGTGAYWGPSKSSYTNLGTCASGNQWETRVVQVPTTGSGPRAYTCNGSTWQALAVKDNGDLDVPGTLNVANISATGTATFSGTVNMNGTSNFGSSGTANFNGNANFASGKTATFSGNVVVDTTGSIRINSTNVTQGSSCTSSQGVGTIGKTSTGQLVQCDGTTWRPTGMHWGEAITGLTPSCGSANVWETRVVANSGTPRAYTCAYDGATYSWQPLGIKTNGDLVVPGGVQAASLTSTSTISGASLSVSGTSSAALLNVSSSYTVGSSCTAGQLGRDSAGRILECANDPQTGTTPLWRYPGSKLTFYKFRYAQSPKFAASTGANYPSIPSGNGANSPCASGWTLAATYTDGGPKSVTSLNPAVQGAEYENVYLCINKLGKQMLTMETDPALTTTPPSCPSGTADAYGAWYVGGKYAIYDKSGQWWVSTLDTKIRYCEY